MPLATRRRHDAAPELAPLPGLVVRPETDAGDMAALQGRTEEEMAARFADGHRAYVAWGQGAPAAWGWVATRSARIGELDAAFAVPSGERYLWNFVTLKSHRGLGIYPRLLDAIVRAESAEAERFWVAYAPENHASGAGIRKAGFATVAELSFDAAGRPALRATAHGGAAVAAQTLGLPEAAEALAACWRCARAAKPVAMSCRAGECRCDYQRPEVVCAA
jgi:ribosomal protein S18 acetylase RimI-like enzyme